MKTLTSLVTLALLLLCLSADAAFYQYQFATTNPPVVVTNIIKEIIGTSAVNASLLTNTVPNAQLPNPMTVLTVNATTLVISGVSSNSIQADGTNGAMILGINPTNNVVTIGPGGSTGSNHLFGITVIDNLTLTSPTVVVSNFVSGTFYTNSSGKTEVIACCITNVTAAVTGFVGHHLFVDYAGGHTFSAVALCGKSTFATTVSENEYDFVTGSIPNGACYCLTNFSSGANNISTLGRGTLTQF